MTLVGVISGLEYVKKGAEHEITPSLVWFRARQVVRCRKAIDHEKTPTRVSFRVRQVHEGKENMPSTQPHHHRCGCVLGVW